MIDTITSAVVNVGAAVPLWCTIVVGATSALLLLVVVACYHVRGGVLEARSTRHGKGGVTTLSVRGSCRTLEEALTHPGTRTPDVFVAVANTKSNYRARGVQRLPSKHMAAACVRLGIKASRVRQHSCSAAHLCHIASHNHHHDVCNDTGVP